ncbi:MAG: DUF4364 family protein [Clostridia bacterium]|nr:DUF4364 family protein [Clostridia bacterium]
MKENFSRDDTETKLILLYMLEQIEIPLSEQFIFDICTTRNPWINYMECKAVFPELIKFKMIFSPDEQSENQRFLLTAQGRNCVNSFYNEIPEALREDISSFCKSNRMYFKRLQEYVADFKKNADGTYMVKLKIIDSTSNIPTFEININLQTRAEAIKAMELWPNKAPNFYEFVYTNLLDWTSKGE